MKSKPEIKEKILIDRFWAWFKENGNRYLFMNQIDSQEIKDKLLDEITIELHKYCDKLFFEIGGHPDKGPVELIITAEGIKENFNKVEQLVSSAPSIKDWEIIAFKPAMGKGFITEFMGKKFDPSKIIFVPLTNKEDPNEVGLQVCYTDYNEDEREIFVNGTYIALDCLIGEKSTTLDIDYMDIIKTPKNITEYNFRHLEDIKEYIDEIKNAR
jgi:hypothetical protein